MQRHTKISAVIPALNQIHPTNGKFINRIRSISQTCYRSPSFNPSAARSFLPSAARDSDARAKSGDNPDPDAMKWKHKISYSHISSYIVLCCDLVCVS